MKRKVSLDNFLPGLFPRKQSLYKVDCLEGILSLKYKSAI